MRLFDYVLPASWRARPEAKPELNDSVLGRLNENDPLYRALMDHAHALLEEAARAVLEPGLNAEARAYLAGRANGLLTYLTAVEGTRERAHAQVEARMKQRRNEAAH